ncbi:patatin [Brachybacterium phenoliresistens]|uniref:Patatin n=1 Tax=Brachybacterium phenoliresistens TaxID=396014 RepID=Z9JSI6_9MICO|nr:patatin-like phospholipase family protein [Brachybacterium phenoliresistens]EWS81340.1 patatin [Brachybacterium phenoliresistens]
MTGADLTIGTSAGATAAAQCAGATPAELYPGALQVPAAPPSAAPPAAAPPAAAPPAAAPPSAAPPVSAPAPGSAPSALDRILAVVEASTDLPDMRRRMSAAAMEHDAELGAEHSARWRSIVARRLPCIQWPQRRIVLTAIDARTGEEALLDRDSGLDLVDAVAASCSSGPAYQVGEKRFLDGGFRCGAENADLAAGHGRVLVLAPLGGRSLQARAWGTHLEDQVVQLRAQGSAVRVVVPRPEAQHLFGAAAMTAALRPDAAREGHRQGTLLAEEIAAFWG